MQTMQVWGTKKLASGEIPPGAKLECRHVTRSIGRVSGLNLCVSVIYFPDTMSTFFIIKILSYLPNVLITMFTISIVELKDTLDFLWFIFSLFIDSSTKSQGT